MFLTFTLAGALVAPMAGMGFLGRKTGRAAFAVTSLLVHVIWGVMVGLIYVPR